MSQPFDPQPVVPSGQAGEQSPFTRTPQPPQPAAGPGAPLTVPPPGTVAPRRPPATRTEKLLTAVLATLIALLVAVLALGVVVFLGVFPPKAPTQHVTVVVSSVAVTGRAQFVSPAGSDDATFRPALEGGPNEARWESDVKDGETVAVALTVASSGDGGRMSCVLTAADGAVLSRADATADTPAAACRWTNGG